MPETTAGSSALVLGVLGALGAGTVALAAAAAPNSPGGVVTAQTLAAVRGDADAVCASLASARLQPLRATGLGPAAIRKACVEEVTSELNSLSPSRAASLAGQRVVQVTVSGRRARVTVTRPFQGLTVRATGTAVRERGRWKVLAEPSGEHVGRSLLLQQRSLSMSPTFQIDDYVLVDQDAYHNAPPAVGDVVVFNPPPSDDHRRACAVVPPAGAACPQAWPGREDERFLKRVVAGPGDTLSYRGRLRRNGKAVVEPHASCDAGGDSDPDACQFPTPITVPPGRWYVMGDDRGRSEDSRFFGPIELASIIGKVRRLGP